MKVPSRIIFKAVELVLDFVGSLFTGKERVDPRGELGRRERAKAKTEPPIPITWSDPPDTPTAPGIPRRMPPRKPPVTSPPAAAGAATPSVPRPPPRRR